MDSGLLIRSRLLVNLSFVDCSAVWICTAIFSVKLLNMRFNPAGVLHPAQADIFDRMHSMYFQHQRVAKSPLRQSVSGMVRNSNPRKISVCSIRNYGARLLFNEVLYSGHHVMILLCTAIEY